MLPKALIDQAVAALRRGELVAFPTETVYGLGADASSEQAVRRIFTAKGRPADHPVIVHLGYPGLVEHWASSVPKAGLRLIDRFWPGPLTVILPRAAHVLDVVTGEQPTVGLRMPDHPVALALLRAFGDGIAAPSANRFGRISPTRAEHVRAELGNAVAMVLDGGPSRVGVESTIVDLSGDQPMLLRPGHISVEAIEEALGTRLALPSRARPAATRAPGTLASHYAPGTRMLLVAPDALRATVAERHAAGQKPGVLSRTIAPPTDDSAWIHAPHDPDAYARDLYASLRDLDRRGLDVLLVESVPPGPAWLAVRDRLQRAAHRDDDA